MLLFVVADHQWSWSMYMCRMNYNSTVPCYKWTNLFYLFKVNWALGIFDQCLHNSGLVTEHCLHEQSTTIFCDMEKIWRNKITQTTLQKRNKLDWAIHSQSEANNTLTSSANCASFSVLSLTCFSSVSTHFDASTSSAIWDGVHDSLSSQLASAPRESNILRNNNIVLFIYFFLP